MASTPSTPDDYAAALDHVRAQVRCPSCSCKLWMPQGEMALALVEKEQALATHVAVCRDCGFVRLHAVDKLEP